MINKSQTNKETTYSVYILGYLYHRYNSFTTKDVSDIFRISYAHASNILRTMWGKGWLSRKLEYVKPHGRRYRYFMTEKVRNLIEWLESKGVIDLPL